MYIALPLIATLMLIRFFQVLKEEYKEGKFIISPKITDNQEESEVSREW
jgi:TRAP-type C4-dicarboxylate transport system permease small subunit